MSGPQKVVCDPDGDVILLVGGNISVARSISIRVSTKVLGLVSPVFRAMFNGRFQEGKNLSPTEPPTVELPDDDPKTMRYFCSLVHYQDREHLKPDEFLRLVILADKYQSKDVVRNFFSVFMESLPMEKLRDTSILPLVIGHYLLEDGPAFREASAALAINMSRGCLEILWNDNEFWDWMPHNLTLSIIQCHEKARHKLGTFFKSYCRPLVEDILSRRDDDDNDSSYLNDNGYLSDGDIGEQFAGLMGMMDPDDSTLDACENGIAQLSHILRYIDVDKIKFGSGADDLRKLIQDITRDGLCLDCIKKGRIQDTFGFPNHRCSQNHGDSRSSGYRQNQDDNQTQIDTVFLRDGDDESDSD